MQKREILLWLGAILLATLAMTAVVHAQSGGDFDLSWNTIDSGGAMGSTGGDFGLSGSIGQAEAGTVAGGEFALSGGFWLQAAVGYGLMLPIVMKN